MAKKEILNNDAVTVRVNAEPVLDTMEQALDVIEDKLDVIEGAATKVVRVTKNNPFLLAGALVLGIGIGALVAYKVTQKLLEAEFDEELAQQIEETRAYYIRATKAEQFGTPESAVQALVPDEVANALTKYQGREEKVPYNKPDEIVEAAPVDVEVKVEEVVVQKNVFVEAENYDPRDWDYRLEIADREANPDQPYVISFEEFQENPEQNEQVTLTYYEEDDVLTDEREHPIDNVDGTVGDDNLQRFGHGSKDRHVVYVRNEKLGMDFEINRSQGSYQMEVLGTEPVIRHSNRRSNRRSRSADE